MTVAQIPVDCGPPEEKTVAKTRRTKKSLKDRPKHRQKLALRNRRRKAKASAAKKRSRNKLKARRTRRGSLMK